MPGTIPRRGAIGLHCDVIWQNPSFASRHARRLTDDARTGAARDREGKEGDRAPPRDGQPSRPDRRRHGHRQDRHAAGAGGAVQRDRRSGLPGGREGGPVRDPPAGGRQPESRGTGGSTQTGRVRIPGVSRHLLGPLRGAGAPRSRHRLGDGPSPPRADPQPERHPVRRPDPRLQDRGRQRHAAAGPEGPSVHGAVRRGQRRPVPDHRTATSPPRASGRSSGDFWGWSNREGTGSSASPRSTCRTSFRPIRPAAE